ncbi:MAG: universal stress protein, partial [Geminicoccaceae bacterium]|nr:universal stress protein [Geminicoccaceae bacterium]
MSLKDLLVHIDDKPSSDKRLDAAVALALACDAHLAGLMLVAEPYVPAAIGVSIPAEVLREQREAAVQRCDAVLAKAKARADQAGCRLEVRREVVMVDDFGTAFARQARHADLSIVGQADPNEGDVDAELVVEASFLDSGRPALVIPYIGARQIPPKRVLIAWDGSREAARAVGDAMPLMRKAESVLVLVVDPAKLKGRIGEQPGADLGEHLARHGLKVEVRTAASGGQAVGDVIIGQASDAGIDLVVMGAYGHS